MSTRGYVHKDAEEWQRDGWTSCPNRILRDPELAWELRAVWCWMASHTEDFDITGDVLWKAGPAGRDKSYEYLRALEERGLLTRHHEIDAAGDTVIRYDLHLYPVPEEQRTARPSKAKARRKFPKLAEAADPDQDAFLTGQESAGQDEIPDRAGIGGVIPDRSVPDRAGIPYKEEKTREEDQSTKNSSSDPATPARDDVEQLCHRLRDRMIENGCKPPTITKAWRDEARRLLDLDKRPLDKALNLIDWATNDAFWRSNIQSMPKFRAQYDKLRLRAIDEYRQQQQRHNGYASATDANIAELLNGSLTDSFADQHQLLALPGGAA